MNKENIFFLALLAIVVLIFATFSVFAFQKEEKLPIITDAMKIKEEFALPNASSSINVSLEDENSFKYISSENALHLLKNESGILFFGSPTNDISRKMINALDEISKEKNIETIYYLDITKISSMRRNRVISDIFNRLHLMERRGSGLTRIIESYNDVDIKPEFSSDVSSFKVVFPNKGYIQKIPVNGEKSPVTSGNFVTDEDYFIIKLHRVLPENTRKSTYNQVYKIFQEFKYNYEFNRDNIEKLLQLKKSRASEIIALLLDCDLIEQASPTKYKFKK